MGRKGHSVEQIIGKLRQAEIEQGRGASVSEICGKTSRRLSERSSHELGSGAVQPWSENSNNLS